VILGKTAKNHPFRRSNAASVFSLTKRFSAIGPVPQVARLGVYETARLHGRFDARNAVRAAEALAVAISRRPVSARIGLFCQP
jgi:hypothetical protein